MSISTATCGIHQSDILIRTALLQGLADVRANPWLLDYVFAYLPNDSLTNKQYGNAALKDAKSWILNNKVSVMMAEKLDDIQFPSVTIQLEEAVEAEATFGDIHYETSEFQIPTDVVANPQIILGPFTPNYDSSTGIVTLPDGFTTDNVFVNQRLVEPSSNRSFVITEISSDTTFTISEDVVADFTGAYISPIDPNYVVSLESLNFREVYTLGLHVSGEATHLYYLYSLILFILLRYKQSMLEARGFERSTIAVTDVKVNHAFDKEIVYSRYIKLTGFVKHYWPKAVSVQLQGVNFKLGSDSGIFVDADLPTPVDVLENQVSDQLWGMVGDKENL
jgi:hypothetical protein